MSLGQRPRVTNAHGPALKARLIQKPSSAIVPSMPQSSSKVIFHIIFSTKDRHPWLGRQRPAANARLSRDRLPRRGCESLPCRRCGRSCSPSSDAAANSLPSGYAGRAEEKILEMDQGPRSRLSPLVLAARLRCVFSEPEPSQLDALLEYVKTQEEHHRSPTFQEEYREFLHKHGVEYDERYAWD